ncbi:MAG: DMT family transporter [Alphaproteobacteria bacterium]|nr:DMT family transporter [Alphaproteobacteria bacterium]
MSARIGVAAAILSSALGGMAAAVTRFAMGTSDPVALAAFRWGIGVAILLPLALMLRARWPRGRDWAGVAGLGLLFFALFFVIFNAALGLTTAARGSLALSTLPLQTMLVGALLRVEKLTLRKSAGVCLAVGGVAATLATGLAGAPADAWKGDLLMGSGVLCMALYSVWSRPFVARSSLLGFLTSGMGVGTAALVALAALQGSFAPVPRYDASQWAALAYLGVGGGALSFYLWVFALERASPTQVAATMAVHPIAASLLAALLVGEPIGWTLAAGVVAVLAGIAIAASPERT